jgi:site-specific recombinase XerD
MNMIIHELIDPFYQWLVMMRSPATVAYYSFYIAIIDRHLGHIQTDALSQAVLINFMASLKHHHPRMKNITLNKVIGSLKTLLKVMDQPPIQFPKLKETKVMIPTIPPSTIHTIFTYYEAHLDDRYFLRNYTWFRLLLDTGLRMHELRHLKRVDRDETTQSFLVTETKTDVDRHVFFTFDTSRLLNTYFATWHAPSLYVFYDETTLQPLTTSTIESMIYRLKKKMNVVDNITPHKWRHTFATRFLARGGDLETLRLILGHSNLKTTQKYLHLSKKDILNNYRHVMDTDKPV